MKFNLIYIAPDFYPNVSGYANACTGLITALAKSGQYSIDVLTFTNLDKFAELDLPNIRIKRLSRSRFFGSYTIGSEFHLAKEIGRIEKSGNYDFIFFETAEFPIAQFHALKKFSDRVIVRIHACAETEWTLFREDLHYKWRRPIIRSFIKNVRNILSTTPYYLEFTKHWYLSDDPLRIAKKRFFVVPNTLPDDAKLTAQGRTRGKPGDRIRFMTLGRMDQHGELQKNFARLLSAFSLLREKDYFNALELIIVGDGNNQASLVRLSDILGLSGTAIFHKQLSNNEVRVLQADCNAVILASTFEGMSVFALEALASGAPLIAAGNTGLRELVENNSNGILINDPLSEDEIAEKIDFFVRELSGKSEATSEASRKKYEDSFSNRKVEKTLSESLRIIKAKNQISL
jgi:glycosyltransferase involved in cell wall biosynthesis